VKFQLNSLLKHLGLVAIGLSIGLATLEIGLRLVPENTLTLLITRRPSRYQLYQIDPQIGWRLRPNVTMRYYDNQIQVNSQGLNDFEHSFQKPPDTYRILLLGDSFAEAFQVPIIDGFPYLLEACLNENYQQQVEVINSGVSYYATAEELFFLQHVGVRYEPDLVLVAFFVGNDIDTYTARETEDGWFDSLGGYLIELNGTGKLEKTWIDWKHPSPYEDISGFQLFLRRYSKLYYILTHRDSKVKKWLDDKEEAITESQLIKWLFNLSSLPKLKKETVPTFRNDLGLMMYAPDFPDGPDTPPKLAEAWTIVQEIFSQIQQTSTSIDAELGVVIIPTQAQAHGYYHYEAYKEYNALYGLDAARIDWNFAAPNQALVQLLKKKNIPSLDLLPHFRAYDAVHNNESFLYIEEDGHLNRNGHQLTTDIICQWFIENGFITEP
jgi:hypothetical protein